MAIENGPVDYSAVLSDLRARRAGLDAAIAAIESMLGQTPSAGIPGLETASSSSSKVLPDSFFGMSIAEGAKKYLAMMKAPQTTQDIADALDKGGMTHTSGNWGNTVGSILNRNTADFVRVKRGTWGLVGWYPGMRKAPVDRPKADTDADPKQE